MLNNNQVSKSKLEYEKERKSLEALDVRCKFRANKNVMSSPKAHSSFESVDRSARCGASRGTRVRKILSKIWQKTVEEDRQEQESLKEVNRDDSDEDLLPIEKDNNLEGEEEAENRRKSS